MMSWVSCTAIPVCGSVSLACHVWLLHMSAPVDVDQQQDTEIAPAVDFGGCC
jgi:hypothetical protein